LLNSGCPCTTFIGHYLLWWEWFFFSWPNRLRYSCASRRIHW